MDRRMPPNQYPWWVRFTLLAGGRTRGGQWLYVGLSGASAVVCALLVSVLDLRDSTKYLLYFGIVAFTFSTLWYVSSIRWIDQHGSWLELKK